MMERKTVKRWLAVSVALFILFAILPPSAGRGIYGQLGLFVGTLLFVGAIGVGLTAVRRGLARARSAD